MKPFSLTLGDPGPACAEPAPEALRQAVAKFNAGDYFECHEVLEALWLEEPGPVRDLYKGVIQVAAGFFHWENGNKAGCLKHLERAIVYLARYAPRCQGLDVAALMIEAQAGLEWARDAEPDTAMPPELVPRMVLSD
uniref:DUF309 domain-containing protein n=1 Tax=Desulfovibrio sp. U5L TaxID=596152 RepID=I2PZI5_9BACT